MSDQGTDPRLSIGGNAPPVTIPQERAVLEDLRSRHPDVQPLLAKLLASAATVPEKITDDETAGKLQDLLRQMKLAKKTWGAARGVEKAPWQDIADAVFSYFKKPEDTVDAEIKRITPRHTAFLEDKAAVEERRRQEEARKQREDAEKIRKAAEEAEQRRLDAIKAEEEAVARAEQARKEAEEAERRRAEAEARAKAAKEEEDRIAREKREREKSERDLNATNLREMRALMKTAQKLHEKAETTPEKMSDLEEAELAELIGGGGKLSLVGAKLVSSPLLDGEQREEIAGYREGVVDLRKASNARLQVAENARQAKAREKAEREREAQEKATAAARAKQHAEEEARIAKARKEREIAEAEALAAKAEAKEAKAEVREARKDAVQAFDQQKEAAREHKHTSESADRTEKRADRMDRKLESATDADLSRTRSDRGTVGSLSGRWGYSVVDRAALRRWFGPQPDATGHVNEATHLGQYLMEDAMDGAVYRFMTSNRGAWTTEHVEGLIPGVIFDFEPESRIS